ncbi:hypothetical protein Tco_0074513, partial [Tanacetum coccineum]
LRVWHGLMMDAACTAVARRCLARDVSVLRQALASFLFKHMALYKGGLNNNKPPIQALIILETSSDSQKRAWMDMRLASI